MNYISLDKSQKDLILGNLSFEILDTSIAVIDSNRKITALKEGKTKVKITDKTNNICTYIYLEVINDVKIDIQNGKNFTVALKNNGTVWSYGLNSNGELGLGNNENELEPVKVSTLKNIKAIATGYSHTLALNDMGEVYSWGLGKSGQLGNGESNSSNIPVKVEGISNIVKIDAYKNISIALSNDGKTYVWGEGYSTLPMRIIFSEKVIDISGTLMLTEKGEVYSNTDLSSPVNSFYNIAKISCGETHNLALDINGTVYAWGMNTYGECGTDETGNISVKEVAYNTMDISAGNCTSIIKCENQKVYVLGDNSNGQIGIENITKALNITEIVLDKKIQHISSGEGTHSSLIAEDGTVWNTGTNVYGELGTGNKTNKNIYSQIGSTIITTNIEQKYLDINESVTIVAKLENTFNLKIDIIDDNQDNFEVIISNYGKLGLNNKTITGLEYCSETVTIMHKGYNISKDIKIIVAMKIKSIVQGFRDANLADGEYNVVVENQPYTVELINYYDDVRYSLDEGEIEKNISLGDSTTDYKMLVVKYHGNLTIDKGVTVTANQVNNLTYKKGMYLCVLGNIYNNGKISMTARGTYNQKGENVYLWENIDNTYEYVPAVGAIGGEKVITNSPAKYWVFKVGNDGESGYNRQTGGGGSGASANWNSIGTSGAGGSGTSYSGGAGGGSQCGSVTGLTAISGSSIGGARRRSLL